MRRSHDCLRLLLLLLPLAIAGCEGKHARYGYATFPASQGDLYVSLLSDSNEIEFCLIKPVEMQVPFFMTNSNGTTVANLSGIVWVVDERRTLYHKGNRLPIPEGNRLVLVRRDGEVRTEPFSAEELQTLYDSRSKTFHADACEKLLARLSGEAVD